MNMKKNTINPLSFWTMTALSLLPVFAGAEELGDINAERERWAVHARSGQAELSESVAALRNLYAQTRDAKVRADLIALLVRQGNGGEALAVCANCAPNDYSADELENLAKAARDNKQFAQSLALYEALQQQTPQQKIGWLGGALAAVDAKEYARAESLIAAYRKQFGDDTDIAMAEGYLKEQSQTLSERMAVLQAKLAEHPDDRETVLDLYRTARDLQAYPVQQDLIERYPQLFSASDRRWLQKAEAVSVLRSGKENNSKAQVQAAYDSLSEVINETGVDDGLHHQALRDRMAAALALDNSGQALRDYQTLQTAEPEQPDYVKELYAQTLAAQGHPHKALALHRQIAAQQMAQKGAISPETTERLIQDYSDLGRYDTAQEYLDSLNPTPKRRDFTHTILLDNPLYAKEYFWQVRLEAWRGNLKGAILLLDNWLEQSPGDPWAMVMRGELASWDGKSDEAKVWYDKAMALLPESNQAVIKANQGNLMMDNGNWAGVAEVVANADENDLAYHGFLKRYDESRAAQLNVSGNIFRATSPADSGNEWSQTATLYSPRSAKGHRVYIREQTGHVPNHGDELNYGSIGVGTELSFYPFDVNIEAGKGLKLNDTGYLNAGVGYRVNQAWSLNARASFNSPNTPVKAMAQDVYANEYSVGAHYMPSGDTRIGLGVSLGDYDDGNVRQGAYTWLSHNIFRYNRWKLDGSLWADYSRNKKIESAYYYNPRHSNSVSADLGISYWLPLDYNIRLTQRLVGSAGRYWQADYASEDTWSLRYGHEWSLGKKVGLSYDFGHKKAIYDGKPEYQNFGSASLNIRFK